MRFLVLRSWAIGADTVWESFWDKFTHVSATG